MDETRPTLLLTRPEPRSSEFLARCERALGERIPAVISPVMAIVPRDEAPPLDDYATLVVTSASALDVFGDGGLSGRRVATVGDATAARARRMGARAEALGPDIETFVANADRLAPPCLHLRGVHAAGDLAGRLNALGIAAAEAIVYDQAARPLSRAARQLLAGEGRVVAPVFSARSATLLAHAAPIRAPVDVVAMSETVAAAWTGPGHVIVADAPTVEAMCAGTIAAL